MAIGKFNQMVEESINALKSQLIWLIRVISIRWLVIFNLKRNTKQTTKKTFHEMNYKPIYCYPNCERDKYNDSDDNEFKKKCLLVLQLRRFKTNCLDIQ